MSEEANTSPVKNNGAAPELSAQNDGTKVPLTNNDDVKVEEAKFKKGDTEIEVGIPKKFSGLTKEELMKYSTDPFWIKLRMFLFALFWLIWLAMLVLAIVIIIIAPPCAPPPERLWVEENAMVNVDSNSQLTPEALNVKMESLDIQSAYFPGLISESNFTESNYEIQAIIDAITGGDSPKKAVTDFPLMMTTNNSLYNDAYKAKYINVDGTWNFKNKNLTTVMEEYLLNYWIDKGITGFLIANDDNSTEIIDFKDNLNKIIKEKKAALGSNLVAFKPIQTNFRPLDFNEFLEENAKTWSFYKFIAGIPQEGDMTADNARLVTIGLFLYGGTPILTDYTSLENRTEDLISELSSMRSLQALRLGNVSIANTTDEQIVAFTRTYKGTPAYAVALNFKDDNVTVSFAGTSNLNSEGHSGKVDMESTKEKEDFKSTTKVELTDVKLGPYEGLVIQFVGNF